MSKVDEALKHLHYHLFNEKDVCDRMNPFKLEKIIKQALEDKQSKLDKIRELLCRTNLNDISRQMFLDILDK